MFFVKGLHSLVENRDNYCTLVLQGPVVLSTPAQLVAPVVVSRGTLSVTTTEIYFEVDEEDPTFKKTDSKVSILEQNACKKFEFTMERIQDVCFLTWV